MRGIYGSAPDVHNTLTVFARRSANLDHGGCF